MFGTIIVEDERIMADGIRMSVNWDEFGISLIGCAYDGISGFDMILEHKPDIILTDIRMPGMSGLALIEKVKLVLPDALFIIISGHTDFEYVRKALVFGVVEYLIKPITTESISEVLKKSVAILKENKYIKGLKSKDKRLNTLFAEKLLFNCLEGRQNIPPQELDSDFFTDLCDTKLYTVVAGRLFDDSDTICDELERSIKETLTGTGIDYLIAFKDYEFAVVFRVSEEAKRGIRINAYLCEILSNMSGTAIDYYMGVSETTAGIGGLTAAYSQARMALEYVIFWETRTIIAYRELRAYDSEIKYDGIFLNALRTRINQGSKDEVLSNLAETLDKLGAKKNLPHNLKDFALMYIYDVLRLTREINNGSYTSGLELRPGPEVEACTNFRSLRKLLMRILSGVSDFLIDNGNQTSHKSILRVKQYIDENYSKDLTLFELSDMANMNPSYFSSTFKSNVKISYIKYLTKVRMEKAEELLKKGMKVTDISHAVGYRNYQYFCEIFKKYHGITAQQYRNL